MVDSIAAGWTVDGTAVCIVVLVQVEKVEEHTFFFHMLHEERVLCWQHINQCSHA